MSYTIADLTKEYSMGELKVPALKGVTLELAQGEFVAVLGPSGSGKTTLLNILGGIDRPSSGKLFFDEIDLTKLKEKELTQFRRLNIGFIFQFYNLVPSLTAFENVELTARLTNPVKEARHKTKFLLTEVGLQDQMMKFPGQLSGGEQQRVSIARALAKNPKILLADEPTGSIDSVTTGKILKLFQKINQDFEMIIVFVTHNVGISYLADRTIYLRDGQLFGTSSYDPLKEKEFWTQLATPPVIDEI